MNVTMRKAKIRSGRLARKLAGAMGLSVLSAVAFSADDEGRAPVTGEASVSFETKALTYGLPDADDPIIAPRGALTFFGHLTVGTVFYFDVTDFGEKAGRGDRSWDFWEIDAPADLRHVFTPEEFAALPTSVELGVGYRYEYHPPRTHTRDTQFWLADVSLPDLWLVPCLSYERDAIRDDGTYLNLSVSRTCSLLDNLSLTLTLGQGWGDRKRVRGYLPSPDLEGRLNRAGLMDTQLRIALEWEIAENLVLSGYVAYSDFLFDRHVRDASRDYIRQSDGQTRHSSWNFPAGIALAYRF